jgi:hypothetical protein
MTDTSAFPTSAAGSDEPAPDSLRGSSGFGSGPGDEASWRSRLVERGQSAAAGEPLRRLILVSIGLMAIAITLVFLAVARGPQISITDEPAHAGYLYMMAHGHIPAAGTLVPEEIRYEWYCHDQQAATGSAVCTGFDNATFQTNAQVYTFGDPPVYYIITGLLDRVVSPLIPGTHNFITVGRDLGALWLFGAMIVLYLAARRFRVAPPYAFAAAALLPLCPGVLASTSQITSDAPAALCGAIGLYVLARIIVDKRMGLIVPFLAAVFATGTKVLSGMPLIIVGGVTLVMAGAALRRGDWRPAVRPLLITVSTALGFLLTYGGWTVLQNHRSPANWVNPNLGDGAPLTGSRAGDLLSNLFGTFQHLTTSYWLQPEINGESVAIWATLLCVLFCAAPLVVMAVSRSWSWGWLLGLGTFVGISAVALAVEAQVFVANDEYFQIVSTRYALAFLPWTIICLAVVAHRRRLLRTSYLFVSLGLLTVFLAETGVLTLGPALSSHTSFLIG